MGKENSKVIKNPGKSNSNALLKAEFKAYKELKEYMKDFKGLNMGQDPEYKRIFDAWVRLYNVCDMRGLQFLKEK